MQGPEPPRPEVTLTASSAAPRGVAPVEPAAAPARSRPLGLLLVLLAVGLLLAAAVTGPRPPPSAAAVEAALVSLPEELTVSQGGVLVLPLELRNLGGALQVRAAQTYAEPVVDDPLVQAPDDVAAGGLRHFVAVIAPDCRLLRPGSPIEFRATVLLRVGVGSASKDLVADLGDAPQVRAQVASLCR